MSTILVVDDSLTVRMDLSDALVGAGQRVRAVASLADARAALMDEPVALVLLDVMLPDGDGFELLAWMRGELRFAEVPVLILSTEGEVKDRVRGLTIGATDYIGKPYDTEAVIARVRELTARAGSAPEARKILVIDDSPTARNMIVSVLERAGYVTVTASDGIEGLRVAARERPAAIIVDGVMPGMDGASVIRRVRLDAALRSTPCLLVTASDDGVAEVDALDAGADAYVRKDGSIDVVIARLASVLRTHGETTQAAVSLHAQKRILVIDDQIDFLETVSEMLQAAGFDVAQSSSGEQALELLSMQRIDCILLDWTLPVLSGREVCTRIKAAPVIRDTPLIVLTGADSRAALVDALGAGADDFLIKTAAADVLVARIQTQIRRRQAEDEQRRARDQLLRSSLTDQLEQANAQLVSTNEELEAFSYSVSHDLRAPLRAIDAFTRIVLEDAGDKLDATNIGYLERVLRAAGNMSEMIEALLELSRVNRAALLREPVDLTTAAVGLLDELAHRDRDRTVTTVVAPQLTAMADRRLVRSVLDNVLSNAWKFTAGTPDARIEVGTERREGALVFFVKDNGAGFDMAAATRLFQPFQRLHSDAQFRGTGVGLATTRRILERHGGKIWAESKPGEGATFYFTFG